MEDVPCTCNDIKLGGIYLIQYQGQSDTTLCYGMSSFRAWASFYGFLKPPRPGGGTRAESWFKWEEGKGREEVTVGVELLAEWVSFLRFASVTKRKNANKESKSQKGREGESASIDTQTPQDLLVILVVHAWRQKRPTIWIAGFGEKQWIWWCSDIVAKSDKRLKFLGSIWFPTAAWCLCGHRAGCTPTFLMATLPQPTSSTQPIMESPSTTTTCPMMTLQSISMTSSPSTTRPTTTQASPTPPAAWPTYLTARSLPVGSTHPPSIWRPNHQTTTLSPPSTPTCPSKA